jgi:hypothetical protein
VIRLSICLAYYRNAGMLAEQMRVWAAYPQDLKNQIEVIVVDDSSPEPAVDVPRPDGLPSLTIGRLSDVADPMTPPWRQDAARNRAAHDAQGDWLFLSDMDHVLPAGSASALVRRCAFGSDVAYSFQRLDMPYLTPKLDKRGGLHPHPNTYAMKKARYWAIGGYDEDACGIYGTDGPFKKRLLETSKLVHLGDTPILRYPREVIPDASTRVDRQAWQNDPAIVQRMAEKTRRNLPPSVLKIPYQVQFSTGAA